MKKQYRIVVQHNNTEYILKIFNSYKQCSLYMQFMNKQLRYYSTTYHLTKYIIDFNFLKCNS